MVKPQLISIEEFSYDLPSEKIAIEPQSMRDRSKLLIYNGSSNKISHSLFSNLPDLLPDNSFLVFNDTKVIKARLIFQNSTGGQIEIFCLKPLENSEYYSSEISQAQWKCLVGGLRKWKNETLVAHMGNLTLSANHVSTDADGVVVNFSWNQNETFFCILDQFGQLPLPPYIKRKATKKDETSYQTAYGTKLGSVAAPTAGLHFTETVLEQLSAKRIPTVHITLHVGAGTFLPVKAKIIGEHVMHAEYFEVSLTAIEEIIQLLVNNSSLVAVGTTSTRTLESLYWIGIMLMNGYEPQGDLFNVPQWVWLENNAQDKKVETVLEAVSIHLKKQGKDKLYGQTQLIITPGYQFKIVQALITNFHQPQSTLLLLIAAFVGDNWRSIYNYALENEFRFLSYGDSSLLLP